MTSSDYGGWALLNRMRTHPHVLANGVELVSPVRPYLRRLGPAACVAVSLGSEREAQAQVGLVDGWSPGPGPWSTVQPGPAASAPWAVD
jgi:hypothetical protein